MIRKTILVMLLALAPMAPASAVIAISATPKAEHAMHAPMLATPRAAAAPASETTAVRFGELAAAGLGLLVVFLAFGTARMPHSVTA